MNAQKHAQQIGWDVEEAVKYALELLTEVNAHSVAAALQTTWDNELAAIEKFEAELERQTNANRGEIMRCLPVRACSIRNIEHPEWGTWGVMEDKGEWYEIFNRGWRVLFKSEAVKFWEKVS